jgi:eukaryotic-like serine/threonine-protein kinase
LAGTTMSDAFPRTIGPYLLHREFASGGMAGVHYGLVMRPFGFSRVVAIKRLRPELAHDEDTRTMLLDEARLSARIRHTNVVSTLDVVAAGAEILVVLDYVHGESFAALLQREASRGRRAPLPVVLATVIGALRGAHAAHETKDERGAPLELVHRDLSPENVLIDVQGTARITDFGIAKARGRMQAPTKKGELRGKPSYMAPEQVHGTVSRRSDVFAMGIVLWEALAGERLFFGDTPGQTLGRVLLANVPDIASKNADVSEALARVVAKSLERRPEERFETALAFTRALEAAGAAATQEEVAAWVSELAGDAIEARARAVADIERDAREHARGAQAGGAPAAPLLRAAAPREARPMRVERLRRGSGRGALWIALVALLGAGALLAAGSREAPAPPVVSSPAPVASAAAPASVVSVEPPAQPRAPAPAPPRHAARGRRDQRPDCDPPFVIDGGRKLFKRECF